MTTLCSWATAHWIRFDDRQTAATLDLSFRPVGAASWKIGSDGPVGGDGNRLPTNIWCGLGLYRSREHAESALDRPAAFLPFLESARESWHMLLLPLVHRGECNHLDPSAPGLMLEPGAADPGGPLVVMTTAGFDRGPGLDMQRVSEFRSNVDRIRKIARSGEGNRALQVFVPHVIGDDGVTMSIWREEADMVAFAYKAGEHRAQIANYKARRTADRTSFTRFRAIRTSGRWEGRDLIAAA